MDVERETTPVLASLLQAERYVSQRENGAAMGDAHTVLHFLCDGHGDAAVFGTRFFDVHVEKLVHVVEFGQRIAVFFSSVHCAPWQTHPWMRPAFSGAGGTPH